MPDCRSKDGEEVEVETEDTDKSSGRDNVALHSLIASFLVRHMRMTVANLSNILLSPFFQTIALIVFPFVAHTDSDRCSQIKSQNLYSISSFDGNHSNERF
jgi:hypothetical protein